MRQYARGATTAPCCEARRRIEWSEERGPRIELGSPVQMDGSASVAINRARSSHILSAR